MKRLRDAIAAVELGAGALGFVFYPFSPRSLTFRQAEKVIKKLPNKVEKIGVFVDLDLVKVEKTAREIGLTGVQIYTPPQFAKKDLLRILAIRVKNDAPSLDSFSQVDYFLLDTFSSQEVWGGSGEKFDWGIFEKLKKKDFGRPIILAGGLTPENVREAILRTGVAAVDVSSGVELSPGIKDYKKLKDFIQKAKLAFQERRYVAE